MNNNDTSDEAARLAWKEWETKQTNIFMGDPWLPAWREAVRRCDNKILEWAGKQLILLEDRERKAFEAGHIAGSCEEEVDIAYLAFKEAQK